MSDSENKIRLTPAEDKHFDSIIRKVGVWAGKNYDGPGGNLRDKIEGYGIAGLLKGNAPVLLRPHVVVEDQ